MERVPVEVKVQRAIEGRYLPEARAERLADQKAYREANAPRPSGVTWNARANKADRRRDERAAQQRAARDQLRTDGDKSLAADAARRDQQWDHKRHATPATMDAATAEEACVEAVTRHGSLARLYRTGAIDAVQLASAVDIASVAERLGRDVAVKTASLETRIDSGRRGDGTFYEALGAVWREIAFREWSRALGDSARLVLHLVLDDAGLVAAAKRYRIGHRRATRVLVDALDRWEPFLRDARKAVDEPALARAHARIA